MTRWIVAVAVGLLMLCEMLLSVSTVFAGAFDELSPGNQKAVRALFEAQRSDPPPGTRRLTLDEIAARKQHQGWGRIFADMKSRGLVAEKNFGQVISSFNHRHHLSADSTITTGANRTVSIRRDSGVTTNHGDSSPGHISSSRPDATTMSMQARAQAGGANGVGHGRGK
jgi:hypothetical protein